MEPRPYGKTTSPPVGRIDPDAPPARGHGNARGKTTDHPQGSESPTTLRPDTHPAAVTAHGNDTHKTVAPGAGVTCGICGRSALIYIAWGW